MPDASFAPHSFPRQAHPRSRQGGYHLLTGATGLLGGYLLHDLLRAGVRVAVLARSAKRESARQRIEAGLARWERETGEILPRPAVLEGSLDIGRWDQQHLQWVAEHCQSVIHNAASLTFYATPDGEPNRSNVEGTRGMLELCRRTGIRHFHHVSTAYVCGLREGRVWEHELDVGQTLGNDYEASKRDAEKLVQAANFLDSRTVYRPSIIVGDSQTGYTSTFHGFYALLKLAHTLVSKLVLGATSGLRAIAALGLQGPECKNFVPVDWVSAVLTQLVTHPEHHGRTYHLTAPQPVRLLDMADVIQEAVETYSTLAESASPHQRDTEWFEQNLLEQLTVYRSYWRDDPVFDNTNTQAAVPHLPCPILDREDLHLLARYAIQAGFGRPRPRPLRPDIDVHQCLDRLLAAGRDVDGGADDRPRVGLQVDGRGGGQWELLLGHGRPVAAKEGLTRRSGTVCRLSAHTYERLSHHRLTFREALASGAVVLEGNGLERRQLAALFEATIVGSRGSTASHAAQIS